MSKKSRSKAQKLLLTDRSLNDIASIEQFSNKHWGKKTAAKYLALIEDALALIERNPQLLRQEEALHPFLQFYIINRHVLVFDVLEDNLILLTVFHGSMDIPSRLAELEPTLAFEVKLLHRKLRQE